MVVHVEEVLWQGITHAVAKHSWGGGVRACVYTSERVREKLRE